MQRGLVGSEMCIRDSNIGLPYETIATCSEDQTVAILRWSEGGWKSTKLPKFHFPVWRVSWSLAGNMLAVAAADNIVIIFEEQPNGSWVRANEINPNAAEKEQYLFHPKTPKCQGERGIIPFLQHSD
eukprot:TRINITY_DN11280_c0_g1_i4.p2 TRINITY_DN11280_c0_g1~~TRINITY_DN11280_c0_g1_i4.p2  ORF type:complete len:127 (+),score=26.26 TRINITY_DN11280_c0_g1_i4:116-496(+)